MMERSKKTLRSIASALMALVLTIGTVGTAGTALADAAKTYSQTELFEEGYNLNIELEEEGAVLMQNKNNALPLSSDVTADLYGYFSYNIIHGGGGSGKGKWDADCLQEKAAFELAGLDVNDDL